MCLVYYRDLMCLVYYRDLRACSHGPLVVFDSHSNSSGAVTSSSCPLWRSGFVWWWGECAGLTSDQLYPLIIKTKQQTIIFGLLFFSVGKFHGSIPLLLFLSSGKSVYSSEWRCVLRLERRKELEEMAPMVVIYPERTSCIASSHGGEGASPHIDDPTHPSPCSFGISSFLTRQSRLHRLGNG